MMHARCLLAQGMEGKFALVNGLNGSVPVADGQDVVLAVRARCLLLSASVLGVLAHATKQRASGGASSNPELGQPVQRRALACGAAQAVEHRLWRVGCAA